MAAQRTGRHARRCGHGLEFAGLFDHRRQLGNQSRPFRLTLDLGAGVADPNSGNVFWTRPHQWLVADAPHQFSYVWYGCDFPAFSQGSFSASVDAGFQDMYVNYTPMLFPGDANQDRRVDINDLTIVLTNFAKTGMAWSSGDFDNDGKVDINDLTIVLTDYGETFAAGLAAVPEPSSLVLLGVGAIGLLVFALRKRTA